ncbi:formylglycine-generating enzyme family protein [Marilutibacter chinensis]|uniref:Formylglycine-generating enzyme family protein n=1 Tax=Marilutibacter chinensis TaxID=2912247 RepID=A0ABS9HPE3_9GAMM|nr:formylglycine-generating enzyme family protein [Lysobacter chinensis]MCF7220215.1 formylglycine-generating enzyme family protein [Lysobacter chinensis]
MDRARASGVALLIAVAGLAFAAGWWLTARTTDAPTASSHAAPPEGMIYVPGGNTRIGADDGMPAERPVFTAQVAPFFMDVHPVTVAQFREFVEATAYVTEAERLGDAAVYDPATGGWRLVPGADWRRPRGPAAPAAPDDHPVTQVSWNDAVAYAGWCGKRLPTEVEWEHAARNARDSRDRYAWGDALVEAGRHRANTWQGTFPGHNTGDDGHLLTSPVGTYGETELGLTDMGGNVWEWTADWFRPYAERETPFEPGPASEKTQRGGSFLCHPSYCHGYRVSARSHSTPDSAFFHVGFRLVKDVEA